MRRLWIACLLVACDTSDGGEDPADAAPTGDAATEMPDGPTIRVWRIRPAEATRERAERIAAALGLAGDVVESHHAVQVVERRRGPVGPWTAVGFGGSARVGAGPRALAASLAAGCNDGADDDGDGEVDREDRECEAPHDHHEDFPGVQIRPDGVTLDGTFAADGALTVGGLALPTLTFVDGDRTLQGRLEATGPGAGTLDPLTGALRLELPLQLVVGCEGPGCFPGFCTLALGPVALEAQDPYAQDDGRAVVAGTFAVPAAAGCAAAADVNASLDLPDPAASLGIELRFDPVIREQTLTLTLHRASGTVTFGGGADDLADGGAAGDVPDDAGAEAAARAVLAAAGIDLPDPVVQVTRVGGEDGADQLARVVLIPRLAATEGRLAPVWLGDVEVDVGRGGRVLGLRSRWRDVEDAVDVPRIAEADALAALPATADPDGRLDPAYFFRPGHEGQAWLDASYVQHDAEGTLRAAVRATDFSPVVTAVTPEPDATTTSPARLEARIERGRPPYTVRWRSDRDGDLGEGSPLEAALTAGLHQITLEVVDDRGAGGRMTYGLEVTEGSPVRRQPQEAGRPVMGAEGFTEPNGSSYVAAGGNNFGLFVRNLALAQTRRGRAAQFLDAVYLEQWRYELDVTVRGQRRTVRSLKCVPGAFGGGACLAPRPPFAVLRAPGPLTYDAGNLRRTLVFDNLPGTFTLDYHYRVGDFDNLACNPPAIVYEAAGMTLAGAFIRRAANGVCPGIQPEVRWTYAPPDGETITGRTLRELCDALPGQEDGRRQSRADPQDISPPPEHAGVDMRRVVAWLTSRGSLSIEVDMYGPWPPIDDVFSWFVQVELRAGGRVVASVTEQRHAGRRQRLVQGLDAGSVRQVDRREGPQFLLGRAPEGVDEIVVRSGIQVAPDGMRVVDELDGPVAMPAAGAPLCGVPRDVLDGLAPDERFTIEDFRAHLFTAVAPFAHGATATSALLQDDDGPTDAGNEVGNTDGALLRDFQPATARIATDMFTHVTPVAGERVASFARDDATPGEFDNYHAKASQASMGIRLGPRAPQPFPYDYVSFPGCNDLRDTYDRFNRGPPNPDDPLDLLEPGPGRFDLAPCVHIHERWPGLVPFASGPTTSRGQDVDLLLLVHHESEAAPIARPTTLVDGETLYTPGPTRPFEGDAKTEQVVWHESRASSKRCHPPGGLDNTARPCRVFPYPVFLTH